MPFEVSPTTLRSCVLSMMLVSGVSLGDSVRLKASAQLKQEFQVILDNITERVRFNHKVTIFQPHLWKLFLVDGEIVNHDVR